MTLCRISPEERGDVYLGVVGPVRTGKSTFIKRFMELLVLPNITEFHERERAHDELPQSGGGRIVMTTEPKFIPAEAVEVTVADGLTAKVRLVDCVGYCVDGALGFAEDGGVPRMVHTPWSEQAMPFQEAAETGTRKVIQDHSTIGIIVTTDGTFTNIPREDYRPAEERVIREMQELGKPFVVIYNCSDPKAAEAQAEAEQLSQQYGVSVLPLDVANMSERDILDILQSALYEFPVQLVSVSLPRWIEALEEDHWLRKKFEEGVAAAVQGVERIKDVAVMVDGLQGIQEGTDAVLSEMDLATGAACITRCCLSRVCVTF